MRSFFFNSRVLVCIVVSLAAFSSGCKPKSTEQDDPNQEPAVVDMKTQAFEGEIDILEPDVAEEPTDGIAFIKGRSGNRSSKN
jgi:hypothetical protein